ncbi:hypothetical protein CGZ93_06555 [Enemella dayhoffiae]|uniref:SURF1-like protein n=1 Tax=Enemella dayhoffiae TaxID=2016507 RepID=A0A255H695_9ACTN|nr:SURF1 family protein [Enemella dayhoffiae]OYO23117.1 hypothetical protein CGZ93_06555 [Enemella dayhoffiae]
MRRLWLRWIALLLFVTVLAVTFVNLGEWQLRRLEERRESNRIVLTNDAAPVKPFAEVFNRPITDADQWQRVQVRGTFDAGHQLQVRYRANRDQPGYEVITPMRTDTGQVVLVDRGFLHVPRGERIPDTLPQPPTGVVVVTGHVRRNEQGRANAIEPTNGQVRLINSPAIAKALPYPVVDGYLSAISMQPEQSGGFEPIALPEITEGPHLSYAVQWFAFTLIGVVGVVILVRGDLKARRRLRAERAAAAARTGEEQPADGVPTVDAPADSLDSTSVRH